MLLELLAFVGNGVELCEVNDLLAYCYFLWVRDDGNLAKVFKNRRLYKLYRVVLVAFVPNADTAVFFRSTPKVH